MRNEYDANVALAQQPRMDRTPHRKHYDVAAQRKENKQCLSVLIVFIMACALGAAVACNM